MCRRILGRRDCHCGKLKKEQQKTHPETPPKLQGNIYPLQLLLFFFASTLFALIIIAIPPAERPDKEFLHAGDVKIINSLGNFINCTVNSSKKVS